MDAVAGLLDGPRARGAFLLRLTMDPPWSLRIEDEAPLTLVAIVRGERVRSSRTAASRSGCAPATSRSRAGPTPTRRRRPATRRRRRSSSPAASAARRTASELKLMDFLGTRNWGNSPDGETVMLTGTYQLEGEISGRLLRALPPLLVLAGDAWDTPLIGLLADEIVKDQPGQEAVLDRLLDLLLIAVLRAWFARPEAEAPGWYRAYADPIVGPALKALHQDPAHQWTVEELANGAGVSRAALARRFNDLVGEPPMSFLTGWRIALAADLLLEPDATVGSVAAKVGYGSPFALSHRVQAPARDQPEAVPRRRVA